MPFETIADGDGHADGRYLPPPPPHKAKRQKLIGPADNGPSTHTMYVAAMPRFGGASSHRGCAIACNA